MYIYIYLCDPVHVNARSELKQSGAEQSIANLSNFLEDVFRRAHHGAVYP